MKKTKFREGIFIVLKFLPFILLIFKKLKLLLVFI